MNDYPECAKLRIYADKITTLTEFFEWLKDGPDGNGHNEFDGAALEVAIREKRCGCLTPLIWKADRLVYEFLGIDAAVLDGWDQDKEGT